MHFPKGSAFRLEKSKNIVLNFPKKQGIKM